MNRFNWIFEIEEYEKHLNNALKDYEDLALLNDINKRKSGAEATIEIIESFLKSTIRIPEKPLLELKRVYVYQHKRNPVKTMARKLNVDESTIARWLREFGFGKTNTIKNNNGDLFGDENK